MPKQYRVLKLDEKMKEGDIAIMLHSLEDTFWHSIPAMTILGYKDVLVKDFVHSYDDGSCQIVIREIKPKKGTQNGKQDL